MATNPSPARERRSFKIDGGLVLAGTAGFVSGVNVQAGGTVAGTLASSSGILSAFAFAGAQTAHNGTVTGGYRTAGTINAHVLAGANTMNAGTITGGAYSGGTISGATSLINGTITGGQYTSGTVAAACGGTTTIVDFGDDECRYDHRRGTGQRHYQRGHLRRCPDSERDRHRWHLRRYTDFRGGRSGALWNGSADSYQQWADRPLRGGERAAPGGAYQRHDLSVHRHGVSRGGDVWHKYPIP